MYIDMIDMYTLICMFMYFIFIYQLVISTQLEIQALHTVVKLDSFRK